jgi:hypothetical protein
MSTATASKVEVGQLVTYFDTQGKPKSATVVLTPASKHPAGSLDAPAEGTANLRIHSPAGPGRDYLREEIAEGTGPRTFTTRNLRDVLEENGGHFGQAENADEDDSDSDEDTNA